MTQTVTAEDGSVHNFPDEATPEMMAAALGATHDPAPAEKPNWMVDTAKSIGSGLVRGAAETAMLPVTVPRLVDSGLNAVLDPVFNAIMPLSDEQKATKARLDSQNPLTMAQDAVRGGMDAVLHKPETTPGKFAETISEFAVPGGIEAKGASTVGKAVKSLVGSAIVPGATSEAAGEVFNDSPAARLIGAIMGHGAVGVKRAFTNTPVKAVQEAFGDNRPTDAQWNDATRIANNQHGVNVAAPSAIQQATNGGSVLDELMRIAEGTTKGGAVLKPFHAQVPEQAGAAIDKTLNSIAPAPIAPSAIGPRASAAADQVIQDTRQGINAETAPLYKAAEQKVVSPDEFTNVMSDPRAAAELKALRADKTFGPDFKDMPDNSVGVLDEVKKRLDDNSSEAGRAGRNNAAAKYGSGAETVRTAATDASPDYANALNVQASRRADVLEPLQAGPVGKIAGTNSTDEVINAVMGKGRPADSAMETYTTLGKLGEKDSDIVPLIVRQSLADTKKTQMAPVIGGDNYYGGARFAKETADPNTAAAMAALPGDGNQAKDFADLLETLQATGKRLPQGSKTAYNQEVLRQLGTGSAATQGAVALKSAGTSIPSQVMDATRRVMLAKNMKSLADLFVSPDGVQRIRTMLDQTPEQPLADFFRNSTATAPPQGSSRRP